MREGLAFAQADDTGAREILISTCACAIGRLTMPPELFDRKILGFVAPWHSKDETSLKSFTCCRRLICHVGDDYRVMTPASTVEIHRSAFASTVSTIGD